MTLPSPRILFICILILLAIVSTIVIALGKATNNFISEYSFQDATILPPEDPKYQVFDFLPFNLYPSTTPLAMASGAISVAMAIPGICFALLAWPDGKRTYPFPPHRFWSGVLSFNATFTLAICIYLLVAHGESAHIDPNYKADGIYDKEKFDFATWICDLAVYTDDGFYQGLYSRQCSVEKANLGMFVVLGILACAAAGMSLWALGKEKLRVVQGNEARRKSWEYWNSHGW